MPDVPEPGNTGASGTQQQENIAEVSVVNPIASLPIVSTVQGLAAGNPRSMGSETTTTLIAGTVNHLGHDLQETRKELREVRNKLESAEQELSQHKITNAVLGEKVEALSRERNIKNLCITIGTLFISFAIDLWKNDFKVACLITVGGVILLIAGWLSPKGGSK